MQKSFVIMIQGVGVTHTEQNVKDANRMAAKFIEQLQAAGHNVLVSSFTYGAADNLQAVECHPNYVPIPDAPPTPGKVVPLHPVTPSVPTLGTAAPETTSSAVPPVTTPAPSTERVCENCHGFGFLDGTPGNVCPCCSGKGGVTIPS